MNSLPSERLSNGPSWHSTALKTTSERAVAMAKMRKPQPRIVLCHKGC